MGFDVMREPWIDCVTTDGRTVTLGIRELLLRAHELREVRDISPLQEYGIYRLLCVIAMDMLKPRDSDDMEDLLDKGRFDAAAVDEYIALCEKDGPCFDLFDPLNPFMQDRYDEEHYKNKAGKDKRVPISNILPEFVTGHNHIHFSHNFEDELQLSYAQCARALCAANLFCFSNGSYPSSINGLPPLYVLIDEKTLYRKIIMNCLSRRAWISPKEYDSIPPAYRDRRVVKPMNEIAEVSLMSGMTLKVRRICLIPSENGTVKEMYYHAGNKFQGRNYWRDPHTVLNAKKNSPLTPEMDKDTWRNLTMIYDVNVAGQAKYQAPMVVKQAEEIACGEKVKVMVYWLLLENGAKYVQWGKDMLVVPRGIITEAWKFETLQACIKKCEEVAELLRDCFTHIDMCKEYGSKKEGHGTSKKDRDRIRKIKKSQSMQYQLNSYYKMAHDKTFDLIDELNKTETNEREKFSLYVDEMVSDLGKEAFNEKCAMMGSTLRRLKVIALAEIHLYDQLGKICNRQQKGAKKE